MPGKKPSLKINEEKTIQIIENYMQSMVEDKGSDGIIIGLSGGIDSVLLATLAVRAIGKEKVHAYFLYDRDSEKTSSRMAKKAARWLGIDLKIRDIAPKMRQKKVYNPPIMKISQHSTSINRHLINGPYTRMFGETPFMTTLKIGAGEYTGSKFQTFMYNNTVQHIENGFHERHRYRSRFLEYQAKKNNLVLMGAANYSECCMGWFVKGGVDDLPISPLMSLYKTQVRQLSRYLKIPRPFINQTPSPDMIKGITDEIAMGILYSKIDIVIDGFERGHSDSQIMEAGITKDEIALVRDIHRLSAWKRDTYHVEPPVDGGINGGLRIGL